MSEATVKALAEAREYVADAATRFYDGTNGDARRREAGRLLARIDAALSHPPQPADGEAQCPECQGSGEVTVMTSDLGPDDYEYQDTCPHCRGSGTLADAYTGVVLALQEEEARYLKACGQLWGVMHTRDVVAWRYRLNSNEAWVCTSNRDVIATRTPGTEVECLFPPIKWDDLTQKKINAALKLTAPPPPMGGEPMVREWPSNLELEDLWDNSHGGHPADFAADVLERWGGCPQGLLGYGGTLQKQSKAPSAPAAVGEWLPISTAPKDGTEVWAFNGEQGRMQWLQGDGYALWAWADVTLCDIDPNPEQPTHWMPLPAAPQAQEGGQR